MALAGDEWRCHIQAQGPRRCIDDSRLPARDDGAASAVQLPAAADANCGVRRRQNFPYRCPDTAADYQGSAIAPT